MRTVNWMLLNEEASPAVPGETEWGRTQRALRSISVDNLTRRAHTAQQRNKRYMEWNVYGVIMGKDFPLLLLLASLSGADAYVNCCDLWDVTEAPDENLNLISPRNFRRGEPRMRIHLFLFAAQKTAKNSSQ